MYVCACERKSKEDTERKDQYGRVSERDREKEFE